MSIYAVHRSSPPENLVVEVEGYDPLPGEDEIEFDPLPLPPARHQETCWQRCWRPITAVAGAGVSLAVRVANLSRWTNAIGSLGVGFFSQAAIGSSVNGDMLIRMRRVCLTMFGQMTLFGLTQAYMNTDGDRVKEILVHVIIGQLGAISQTVIQRLWKEKTVRVESHTHAGASGEKFKYVSILRSIVSNILHVDSFGTEGWVRYLPSMVPYVIRTGVSGTFAVLISIKEDDVNVIDDPVLRGLLSFAAAYYGTGAVSGLVVIWLNHQIENHDSEGTLTERGGTNYRAIKDRLNLAALVAIPVCFIPWTANPDSAARLKQLVFVGGVLGFFDEIRNESIMERFRKIPVNQLGELKEIDLGIEPVVAPPCSLVRLRHVAYRVWEVATPVIYTGGLIGFVVWQVGYELDDENSKIALKTMLGSFIGTLGLCKVSDWTWDPDRRGVVRDKLLTFLYASPRVGGINPLYVYLAGTNALALNNHSIEAQESKIHVATIITAWAAQGFSAARELWLTSDRRIGSDLIDFPLMLVGNGFLTTKLYISGVIG